MPRKNAKMPPQANNGRTESDRMSRYPEDEIVAALNRADDEPVRQGAELDELFRAVTGRSGRTE